MDSHRNSSSREDDTRTCASKRKPNTFPENTYQYSFCTDVDEPIAESGIREWDSGHGFDMIAKNSELVRRLPDIRKKSAFAVVGRSQFSVKMALSLSHSQRKIAQ